MNITAEFFTVGNSSGTFAAIFDFHFKKDVYTPYTTLDINCKWMDELNLLIPTRMQLTLDGFLIHDGLIEKTEWSKGKFNTLYHITSKGFTSQLLQNQITPGLYPNKTFNQLMSEFIALPNISYENGQVSSYIFVKYGSSMWDAVVNFCYKVYHRYPYINGANNVAISARSNPKTFVISPEVCYSKGIIHDYRKLISHFHMQDYDGTVNAFNFTDSSVTGKNIHREKQYEYDQQYNSVPPDALKFRSSYSKRGVREYYCEYSGYNGEDLNDKMSYVNFFQDLSISKIEITAKDSVITTRLSAYLDDFNNVGAT